MRHMQAADVCIALFGIIASSLVFITGLFGIINAFHNQVTLDWIDTNEFRYWSGETNPLFASAQQSLVLITLGIISFLAEINFEWILRELHILASLFGHGVFYTFCGFFCLGIAGNLGLVLGTAVGAIGLLYIFFSLIFGNRYRIEYTEL